MWQPQSHREHFFWHFSVNQKLDQRLFFFILPSYNIWAHLFQTLPGDPLVGINKVHCFHFSVWMFLAAHKSLCHSDFVSLWVVMCHETTMLAVERNWKSCEGQQFYSLLHPQAKLFKISPAWSHFKVSHYFKKTPPALCDDSNKRLQQQINSEPPPCTVNKSCTRACTILPNNPKKQQNQ